jgi:hypothetical protein
MIAGPSLGVDPDLYVICMIRDPRDIICSKHKKDPGRYWAGLKFWNLYSKMVGNLVQYAHFIPIRYENFVSSPDEVQKHIAKKIPFLKQRAPFSEYHKTASVSEASQEALRSMRPIKPASVGKWRKHKDRIAGQVKLHSSITGDLIKFGYEKDDQWLHELDNVEPDMRNSHFSENMTFKEERLKKLGRYMEAARRLAEQKMGRKFRITHPKKWFRL